MNSTNLIEEKRGVRNRNTEEFSDYKLQKKDKEISSILELINFIEYSIKSMFKTYEASL